jgi:UPF0716 protein FxsA
MSILARLALLFVVIPILELVLLVQLGQIVGLLPTLALVVLTGVAGATLARAEGLRVFWAFQKELASGRLPGQSLQDEKELASGRLPGQSLQDGIAVLVGGAFLLTPGILTDLAGFALLLPVSRRWIQGRVRRSLERRIRAGSVRVLVGGPGFWHGGGAPPPTPELDPDKEISVDPPGD